MGFDDELWERLVAARDGWHVREDPDGVLEVALSSDPSARRIILVLTRRDWSELVSIAYGTSVESLDDAIRDVQTLVADQPAELPYLVYDSYELVPSATPVLPPDPELVASEELARQHPGGIPGAGWFAYPPDDARTHRRGTSGEGGHPDN